MVKSSAIPVLTEWERFSDEYPQGSLREFAVWLLNHLDPLRKTPLHPNAEPLLKTGRRLSEEFKDGEEFLASFFVGRLNRYAKAYVKPIMATHGFGGSDEFAFLSLVGEMAQPTKKEVCVANATEFTTGMDIIRRLLRQGLLEEAADERDARAKRLTLTAKGHSVVQQVIGQLMHLEQKILADLDAADKQHFLQTLQYLNNYHFQFYKP